MYDSLEKQMKILIENLAPSTNYCKTCTITGKNNDGTVDVIADFGQQGKLTHRICIGNPNIGDIGVLIPLNDDWNNSIVISKTTITLPDNIGEEIVSIKETIIEYGVSSSNAVEPSEWSKELPEVPKGNYLWTKTTIIYTNGKSEISYTISYQGKDGMQGNAGSTHDFIYYTTDSKTPPATPTKTTTIYEKGYNRWCNNLQSVTTLYKYAYISYRVISETETGEYSIPALWSSYGATGATGAAGEDGADGEGLEMIFYKTATQNTFTIDPSTIPNDAEGFQQAGYVPEGWSDSQQGVEPTIRYEYVSIRTKGSDGVWNKFNSPKLWATYSEDGKDGDSVKYIYCRSKSQDSTLPPLPEPNAEVPDDQSNDPDNQIWCDDPAGVIGTLPYEWVSKSIKTSEGWGEYSTPVLWAIYSFDGEDGKQGIQGDKGDAGEDGKDGTTLPQEILDKLSGGTINADFLNGHSSEDFVDSEVEEYFVTVPHENGTGDVTARKQGNVVNVYIRGVYTTTTVQWDYTPIPGVKLPDSMLPDFGGRFYMYDPIEANCRVCIETDGRIGTGIGLPVGTTVRNYVNFNYITNPVKGVARFLTATGGEVQEDISVETGSSLIFKIQGTGSPESTTYSDIAGANVIFTVNGTEYPVIADDNGLCKLNIELTPGTYSNCKVSFKGNENNRAVTHTFNLTVTKLPTIVFSSTTDGVISIRTGNGLGLAGEQYQLEILGTTSTGTLDSTSNIKIQLNQYRGEFTVKVTLLASSKISANQSHTFTFTGTSTGSTMGMLTFRPGSVSQITCSRCRQYNNVSVPLVSYRDEQYVRTPTLASASGTYHTPAGLKFTNYDFSSIPAHATINKITVTVVYGHFGYTAVSNAGSFDAPTLKLVTDAGNVGPQNCSALNSSNWNNWVSSSLVFNNVPRSLLNSNFAVEFVPKQNKSGNIPYFAFDYVELAVEYKY